MIAHDCIKVSLTYEILHEIAQGGMGHVYEALQCGSDGFKKRVAIKSLLENFCNNETYIKLFIHEAKLVSELVHENIVQVYQLVHTDNNIYYIMEFIDGFSLRDFIDGSPKTGISNVNICAHIVIKIAYALHYAHTFMADGKEKNIIHRDIRPNNILISKQGTIKISDFGVAQENTFKISGFVGTSAYIAPEIINHLQYSIQSDLYALGLLFFELLAGESSHPLSSAEQSLFESKEGHINWQLLPQNLDANILNILEKTLMFDPKDRYVNCKEFAEELEKIIYADGYINLNSLFINFLQEHFLENI